MYFALTTQNEFKMYKEKVALLLDEMYDTLKILIYHYGEPSEFTGDKCLKTDEELSSNLGVKLWIHEIHENYIMCYIGDKYDFNAITFEKFGELIDLLVKKYS